LIHVKKRAGTGRIIVALQPAGTRWRTGASSSTKRRTDLELEFRADRA